MEWSKYSSLKTANKVDFEKVAEVKDDDDNVTKKAHVVLAQKQFNPDTGEALDDYKKELSLANLESDKAGFEADKKRAEDNLSGLTSAIDDFKKV